MNACNIDYNDLENTSNETESKTESKQETVIIKPNPARNREQRSSLAIATQKAIDKCIEDRKNHKFSIDDFMEASKWRDD
jgi:hypothetical protein